MAECSSKWGPRRRYLALRSAWGTLCLRRLFHLSPTIFHPVLAKESPFEAVYVWASRATSLANGFQPGGPCAGTLRWERAAHRGFHALACADLVTAPGASHQGACSFWAAIETQPPTQRGLALPCKPQSVINACQKVAGWEETRGWSADEGTCRATKKGIQSAVVSHSRNHVRLSKGRHGSLGIGI